MIVYKIRSKSNPTSFLKGTPAYTSWDKDGRMVPTIGKLRSFITNSMKYKRDLSNWDIIEFEMVEKSVKGVHEVITAKKLIELITR